MITKLATERKIGVRTQFKINPDTVPAFLKLVHPKLEYQLQVWIGVVIHVCTVDLVYPFQTGGLSRNVVES